MKFTLKQARKHADKTQLEMAKILGISRDTYMKLERSPEEVTIKQALIISNITGIPYDDIFFTS